MHASKLRFDAGAALLLVFMALLAGGAALRESAGIDEVAHIGAGVSYLQRLDLRLNEEHPPLSKVMAAAPLVARRTRADYNNTSWTMSEGFFYAYGLQWVFGNLMLTPWNDYVSTLQWARLPMLLLTLGLGWMIYVYASRIGGPWGGLLCLCVYVSIPAFIAFGPMVLNDIPITFFSLWTIWEIGNLWREPTRKRATILGVALAGAMLSKFSAGILLLCIAAMVLSTRIRPLPGVLRTKHHIWRVLFVCAAIVYVTYLILSWNQPTGALNRLGHSTGTEPLRRLMMPAWLYLRGLFMMIVSSSRPTYLFGHPYPHGVPYYFPALLIFKLPIGFLALLALALFLALRQRGVGKPIAQEVQTHWRALWLSLVVFCVVIFASRLNISIRHFSVPLGLMILLLAPLPRLLLGRWQQALVVALCASCLVTTAIVWPNYIPYVNAFAFGHPAYELMHDSNVDWDHALPDVGKFAAAHAIRGIKIDAYAMSDPKDVVPGADLWDCQAPTAADGGTWVVVSSNMILESHNCAWIMHYPHQELAGGSMYAVHLPQQIPSAGTPEGPPPVSGRRMLFGMPFDMRTILVDLVRHPNTIAEKVAEMEAQFRSQEQKKQ